MKLIVYHLLNLLSAIVCLIILNPFSKESATSWQYERSQLVSCFLLIYEPIKLLFIGYISSRKRDKDRSPFSSFWEKNYSYKNLNNIIINLLYTIILISIIILSLGAPLTRDLDQTLYLAHSIVFMAFLPILLAQRTASLSTKAKVSLKTIITYALVSPSKFSNQWDNSFALNLRFICLGAWFGVLLLKLDWIVPWKIYPITSLMASSLAYLVSSLVNLILVSLRL